jgi:hypothetical protein
LVVGDHQIGQHARVTALPDFTAEIVARKATFLDLQGIGEWDFVPLG